MLRVHVLNVGHGDCIVVEFPSGRLSVVDVNRSGEMDATTLGEILNILNPTGAATDLLRYQLGSASAPHLLAKAGYRVGLTDPIPYIKGVSTLPRNTNSVFRFISTHPHMDHLSGLASLQTEVGIENAWILPNSYSQDQSKLTDSQKRDWSLYEDHRDGTGRLMRVVQPYAGSTGDFWTEDGITILAPTPELLKAADEKEDANAMSYVVLIKYGQSKVVLGGDAEKATWDYIVETSPSTISNCQLLKAPHHGRDSGYHQKAVKLMNPEYTAVSVGKKPETDASNKYRQYSRNVVSTRWHGTMVFELTEYGHISFLPENNPCSPNSLTDILGRHGSLSPLLFRSPLL